MKLAHTPISLLAIGAAFLATPRVQAEITKEQKAFFEQKIEPLFSDNCYKCHSVTQKVKGGLALDSREGLLKGGDDGKVIVPGHPADSTLIQRINSKDADEKMPPKDGPLTAQQIADLTAWVRMGAPDPRVSAGGAVAAGMDPAAARKHWAWQPVRTPAVPVVKDPGWCKTPLDNFVLAKLEQKNLTPSPMADRATLIRRAYFDLLGLPPMPWEVQAFIDDKSPNAWAKVVDRLLASPHYGERWGRYWLDIARYSDTKGDPSKKESPLYVDAWSYRDYVVDAFNADKPYDRFIVEQLAADKLNLGQDKKPLAALGFLTVGDRFNGNRNDMINDQIDVVSKGFLGLTVTCARCHDHKFDPIPQKDYYSLHGVFASTLEPKENPIIAAEGNAKEYSDYVKAHDAAETSVKEFAEQAMESIRHTFRQHAGDFLLAAHAAPTDRAKYLRDVAVPPRVAQELMGTLTRRQNFRKDPVFGLWNQFADLTPENFAEKAPEIVANAGTGGRFVSPNPQVVALFRGKPVPASLEEVASRYTALFQEVDKKAANVKTATPAAAAAAVPGAQMGVMLASAAAAAPAPAAEDRYSDELRLAPFRVDPAKALDANTMAALLPQQLAGQIQKRLSEVARVDLTAPGAPMRAMAVEDAPHPQDSPVFIRGEATSKGEMAPRRFLEILSGPNRPDFREGSGRLELAKDIASPNNPLTARVMINRMWEHHFGEGFVTTPDDFGTQSAPPSHPELLDYLAVRFMQSGWSMKTMHRLIMLSSVYQQQSETNAADAAIDPNNRLLWRCNLRRLEFEPLRDSLLYIAGKLDLTVGGHPVNILAEPYSMRRSVYGFIDRGNLPEMMNQFDFANPGLPLGKRHETTVPQQALFMMNSPLMVEVSRCLLARPEMEQAKDDAQRIHALYWMIYQRPPKPEETELGMEYLKSEEAEGPSQAGPQVAATDNQPVGRMTREQLIAMRKEKNQQQRRGGGFQLENTGDKVDRRPLTAWEKYTHALLMANEAVYYN